MFKIKQLTLNPGTNIRIGRHMTDRSSFTNGDGPTRVHMVSPDWFLVTDENDPSAYLVPMHHVKIVKLDRDDALAALADAQPIAPRPTVAKTKPETRPAS